MQLLQNKILFAGILAWLISQILKTIIHLIVHKTFDRERLLGDGGMPSSHSATVTAVAVSTFFVCGWKSPEFALAFFLAVIVMHDAMGVRQETGKQARVINDLVEYFQKQGEGNTLTPEETLKELVGHTPLQVFMGCCLGIVIGLVVCLGV